MAKSRSLRRLRQSAGLTLEQLSDRSGQSFGHLAAIERGERRPSPESLKRILDAIDATPAPDPAVELAHDVAQDLDVLQAESAMLQAGIETAAARIGAGQDRELNLRLVAHAIRRTRAILAALRLRVGSLRPA
jgi:transcriptional regulator with XRE-family HTH domain